jgi:hypothetical protein
VTTHHITVGGALIGLMAALIVLVPWYRANRAGKKGDVFTKGTGSRKRNWAALGPFGWAFTLGTLSSLATGGLMGKAAMGIANGSNTLGSRLLSSLAGADSPTVTRHGITLLSPGGAGALLLVELGLIIWWRLSGGAVRWQMAMGVISGATLGPTAGIAGIAGVILAPAFNTGGGWLVGLL